MGEEVENMKSLELVKWGSWGVFGFGGVHFLSLVNSGLADVALICFIVFTFFVAGTN